MTYIWNKLTKFFGTNTCKKAVILIIILAICESLFLTVAYVYFGMNMETFESTEKALNLSLFIILITYLFYGKYKQSKV
ncbi:MAG: hypothetical protein NE334_19520 [Lentisphaeraceae bacterium]|nr:hypothetical protein [Lentisphaeraceae bacterium]